MTDISKDQRDTLTQHLTRLCELDTQLTQVIKRAEATGDLTDDLDCQAGSIIFNIGRAADAALSAMGELNEEPELAIHMTDPVEIIKRCEMLIDVSEEYIITVTQRIGK